MSYEESMPAADLLTAFLIAGGRDGRQTEKNVLDIWVILFYAWQLPMEVGRFLSNTAAG